MSDMRQLISLCETARQPVATTTLNEVAPPGKKAEHFIKGNKADFRKRYGKNWKRALYATAWKQFGESASFRHYLALVETMSDLNEYQLGPPQTLQGPHPDMAMHNTLTKNLGFQYRGLNQGIHRYTHPKHAQSVDVMHDSGSTYHGERRYHSSDELQRSFGDRV